MKTKFFCILGLLMLALAMTNCAGKRVNLGEASKITKGPVSIWASWVKDKGKKWDALLHIGNESDKDIVIMFDDVSCWRGNNQGDMKYSIYIGDRVLFIRAGRKLNMTVVCHTAVKSSGAFIVAVKHAYENPSGDGVSRGKALVSDVEWRVNTVN